MDGTPNTTAPRRGLRRVRPIWLLPVAAITAAGAFGAFTTPGHTKSASLTRSDELVCTNGTKSVETGVTIRTFKLTAKYGQIHTPDGNQVPMWGYASDEGDYSYPSPFLCANEGETIKVSLTNGLALSDPIVAGALPPRTSIQFPGQTGVTADGAPVQPEIVTNTAAPGTPATTLQSAVQSVDVGQSVTYSFVASKPGSFLYLSGTNAAQQEQMGLFGALVIHPSSDATGPNPTLFNHTTELLPSTFADSYGREYAQVLSDVDSDLHQALDHGKPYEMTAFTPRYWFINGRSMPDTIAPNGAEWLPAQPYSGLVHVLPLADGAQLTRTDPVTHVVTNLGLPHTVLNGYDPLPVAVRYFNASETAHPFHPHAADTLVHGVDGAPLVANGTDLTINHYVIEIAANQTIDSTWFWKDTHGWDPATNPIPVPTHDFRDTRYTVGNSWFGGSPYLGKQDDLPMGITSFNECGEYYHVAHSHAVNEATTFGAAMGGMLTLYRIDPPGHWGCAQ